MNFKPIYLNPNTGKRQINGLFLTLVLLIGGAFFYYGFLNKKEDIVKDTVKTGVGDSNRSRESSENSMPVDALSRKKAELEALQNSQSRSNPTELKKKEAEVNARYDNESELEARSAAMTDYERRLKLFMEEPRTEQELTNFENTNKPDKDRYDGWKPFSVRKEKGQVKAQPNNGSQTSREGLAKTEAEQDKTKPIPKEHEEQVLQNYQKSLEFDEAPGDQNFLPLGTYIPAVLLEDVITTDLQQYVTVSVADDVTFRKRLQLPKGAVMLRGRVGREPVQNVADIFFDVMIFADGTELPCAGVAYSALDIRYPDRFRTRGLPGEIITPPLYIKAKALYYTALAGGLESYLEDSSTQQAGSGDITINPPESSKSYQDYFGQKNPQYVQRALARGTVDTLNVIKDDLQADLEKYKPYVKIEKGTPLFIQLEQTVNLNARAVNGLAKAQEREKNMMATTGIPISDPTLRYPPGDARAGYQAMLNPQVSSGQTSLALPPGFESLSPSGQTAQDAYVQRQIQQRQLEMMNEASRQLQERRLNPPPQ